MQRCDEKGKMQGMIAHETTHQSHTGDRKHEQRGHQASSANGRVSLHVRVKVRRRR
jgi:hypothetical protein